MRALGPIPIDRLQRNLESVRARIAAAAARAGRSPGTVTLVAVTKYVTTAEIAALHNLGISHFGESRIQDAEAKIKALRETLPPGALHWHLIGHLQTNKADKAVALFDRVHSVDSLRVAQALNKEALKRRAGTPLPCLLEVNVAGEASKFGLAPDAQPLAESLHACTELTGLHVCGLMTMAPYSEQPEATSRPVFRRLRELRDALQLADLSMGMTQDYELAIEEGATFVRVGSALFE